MGIVMWEVVTGCRPYAETATPILKLLREISTSGRRPLLPVLPFKVPGESAELCETRRLFSLVASCWQGAPGLRPTAREALTKIVAMQKALGSAL
jgi:hypothetical protein